MSDVNTESLAELRRVLADCGPEPYFHGPSVTKLLVGPLSDPAIVAQLPGAQPLTDIVRAAIRYHANVDRVYADRYGLDDAVEVLDPAARAVVEQTGRET
jgi:hypothetical protein